MLLYARQRHLENIIAEQFYEQEKNNDLMISILSHIVEFRNGESGLHVLHIKTITELLLKELLRHTDLSLIHISGRIRLYYYSSLPVQRFHKAPLLQLRQCLADR